MQYDSETNTVNFQFPENSIFQNKIVNNLNKLLFSFEHYFSKKIKFKGKGFRLKLKKSKKIIKFFFGHSHTNIAFIKNLFLKKSGKYKFILKSVNYNNLQKIAFKIYNVKPINIFTNRGIRVSRQIIFKRKGKKGSYT
jgi:ribosomal protein L6P/L9E